MRRLLLPTLCIAVLAIFLAKDADAQRASDVKFATEVPLMDCEGLPCIEARIAGGPALKMGIDTGNVDSVLDTPYAEAAGLKPTAALPAGAPTGMYRTVIPSIRVGNVTLMNVGTLAMSLSDMISQNQMPHVDGTLSYTAFKDRILQIDFVARKVRISEVLTAPVACTGACDKISLIKFGKEGPPIVVADGFEINGKKMSAQIDTMYSGSLLVYTASIEKLQLADAAKTTKSRDFPFTDGGVKMKEAPAQMESFHGLALSGRAPLVYFPTPDVHEPDGLFDATVGLELFYRAALTLNFHDMTVSVEKR
ncbi:MAG TPA: retropepsin-like aspartic protease [Candidatus Acidoferrum sp.]|nr:retropepsin-like aspartic protease [Candidatus Acidoferrum sp.]